MRYFRYTLAALACWFLNPASAATLTVTTDADELNADGDCSLREAIEAANTNAAVDGCGAGDDGSDTIVFSDDLSGSTITVNASLGDLRTTEAVVIDGSAGDDRIAISGGDAIRVLLVRQGMLTLRNVTVRDGLAGRGAGVFISSGAMFTGSNVDFVENEATSAAATDGGGGLYITSGTTATLTDCSFEDNVASGTSGSGGAILNNGGTLTATGSSFEGNTANRAGGAIEATGASTTTLTDTDFADNQAGSRPGNGGAFHISATGSATVTGGTVSGNEASNEGGGFWNNTGTMTLSDIEFTGNVALGDSTAMGGPVGGGAVFNNGGTLVATDITASGNMASGFRGSGGAIMGSGGSMTLTGGTISGNMANRAGAGIENAGGTVTMTDVTVSDNAIPEATAQPGNGGGLHSGGGTVTVNGGTFSGNEATEGGGLWSNGTLVVRADTSAMGDDGRPQITGNTGRGPTAANGGGGIYVEVGGTATITDADIMDNAATGASGSGGGILVVADGDNESSATISTSTISGNAANRAGAGIENAGGTVVLTDVVVSNNSIPSATAAPGNGGGLHSGGGTVTVNGGTFSDNEATEGGGLWSNGTLVIRPDSLQADSLDTRFPRVTGNIGRGADASNGGGGVYAESGAMITIMDAIISGNQATGTSGSGGGVLVADSSSVTIMRGMIADNTANRAGAGIEVADDPMTGDDGDDSTEDGADTVLSLVQVTVDGNTITTANPGNGGGLHIGGAGEVTVSQSTFSNNAAREGAGLWAAGPSTLNIDVSTVSGNAATEGGGGVYDNGGATISIQSATIALNSAATGGGLLSQSTDGFTVANTILALNTATDSGADCAGTFVSGDYNFIQMTDGCTFTGETDNNITGQDPMLGPLADNGGETLTHLPLEGSPVIDAGRSNIRFDQRGLNRTDEQNDIGSYELEASPVAGEDDPEADRVLALTPAQPNPVRDRARVRFTLEEGATARVELYNVLGQRVQVLFEGTVAAGAEQSVEIDANRLAAGVYVVRLQSRDQQVTQRLTVVR